MDSPVTPTNIDTISNCAILRSSFKFTEFMLKKSLLSLGLVGCFGAQESLDSNGTKVTNPEEIEPVELRQFIAKYDGLVQVQLDESGGPDRYQYNPEAQDGRLEKDELRNRYKLERINPTPDRTSVFDALDDLETSREREFFKERYFIVFGDSFAKKQLKNYDLNRDGYIDLKDDINGDGSISEADKRSAN